MFHALGWIAVLLHYAAEGVRAAALLTNVRDNIVLALALIRTSRSFTTGTVIESRLLLRLEDADFGFLGAAVGDGKVEAVGEGAEIAGAGAGSGGQLGDTAIGVGGGLLNGVEEAFAAGEIEAFAEGVVEEVVYVAGDSQVGDRLRLSLMPTSHAVCVL